MKTNYTTIIQRTIALSSLLFNAIFLSFSQQAPVIQWQNTIGGFGNEWIKSSEATTDGGFILGGYSNSNISGDKTENSLGGNDYWIVKLNSSGAIQWQNTIGGSGDDQVWSISQTADGGFFVGGFSNSNISGDKTENSLGSYDYWVVKLDASGVIQWQNTIGGSGDDRCNDITQTSDGGYALSGYSSSGISGDKNEAGLGGNDVWVVKLDNSGVIEWQNTVGGSGDENNNSIFQTSDGGYILGGHSGSGISGDHTEANLGCSDYWIFKLDNLGNVQWDNNIGGGACEDVYAVEQTSDGGFIIGGYSASNISLEKSENNWGGGGFPNDYWVIKLDAFGVIQWDNTIGAAGGDLLYDLSQTSDGGFVLAGTSTANISGDKTENSIGGEDYWVVKLNNVGAIQWQKTIGGSNDDYLTSVTETSFGDYFLCGFSNSGNSGLKTENSQGGDDFWVLKLICSPSVITPDVALLLDLTGSCSVTPTAPTATNDCGDVLTGTTNTNFPITTQGTTVITWTYTDGVNTFTQNQNVITGPLNYSVSPLTQSICPNSSTTINLANSTLGVNYYLRDNSDNSIVDGPIEGTGGPLIFTTNSATTAASYNVYAATPSLGLNCGVYNATYDGSALLNLTNNLTIETWVYPRNAINSKLVHKSPIGSGYILGLNGGQLFPRIWDNMGVLYQSTAGNVPSNQWSHVAMTWETGGFFTGYVNGVQVFQIPASSNPISVNGNSVNLGEFPFDGILDEIRIWNTTRTNAEISNNMFSCLTGSESGLVTYHKMNHPANTAFAQDATANNIKVTPVDVSYQFGINGIDVCSTCSSQMTQIATVTTDDVAPIAICQNATVNLDESGFGTLLASAVDNGSTDNCSIASFSVSPSTFSCSNLGTNTSIFTATDISGNSATCSFNVLVEFPAVTNLGVTNILPDAATVTWNTGNIQGFGWYSFRYKQTSSGTWINYGTITGSAISKIISGLAPGTEYEVQIKRHANAQCTSAWSSSVIFTTASSGCGAPMVFNTPTQTYNSVTLTWTAVSGAAWYECQYKEASSGTWINAGTLTGTATSKLFTGLTAGTAYNFRGRTFCPGGTPSSWSVIANATTNSSASGCALPPVIAASSVSGTSSNITWPVVAGAGWYSYRYSAVSASGPWTNTGSTNAASTSKLLTGLSPNTTYYFEMRTHCPNGQASAYNAIQFTTTAFAGCELPPVLTVSLLTTSSATITWPSVVGAAWYTFQYKQTGSPTWISAGSLNAASPTTKTLTGLTPDTQYDFQARTFCANGLPSAWSSTLQFTTALAMPLQPKPGTDLANDKALENTSIDVNVYPNPTSDLVNIETIFEEENAAILVKVIDMNGRVVLEMNTLSVEGKNNISLNLNYLNIGIYNLELYKNQVLIDRAKVIKTN